MTIGGKVLGAVAGLVLLVGCDGRPAAVAQLTGDATAGETLYMAHCTVCHGASGEGTASGKRITGEADESVDELASVILNGEDEMPAFDTLEDQQVADIVAFVKTL